MAKDTFSEGIAPGGLRDRADIKLLVCYLLKTLKKSLTRTQINEILGEYSVANYFEVNGAISELISAKQITSELVDGDELITITGKAEISTGNIDCKFGVAIETGQAEEYVLLALNSPHIDLAGYHCHIGSQIFEKQSFVLAVEKCMNFCALMKEKLGFVVSTLNLGGGYGIWYTDEDRKISAEGYAEYLEALIAAVKEKAKEKDLPLPYLLIEPGRSIVGEAGVTLYTVGAIKDIPGVKKYVAIDGGMFDGCEGTFCLKITDTTGGNYERAIQMIKEKGFNPDDYEIIYENKPITPLNN